MLYFIQIVKEPTALIIICLIVVIILLDKISSNLASTLKGMAEHELRQKNYLL